VPRPTLTIDTTAVIDAIEGTNPAALELLERARDATSMSRPPRASRTR
jgi:hypothetical protein